MRQGGPGMRASAAYTPQFARAILKHHIRYVEESWVLFNMVWTLVATSDHLYILYINYIS